MDTEKDEVQRTPEMAATLDKVSEALFGRKHSDCTDKCVTCGKPKGEFRNEISKREWAISRMCQQCQDSVFGTD